MAATKLTQEITAVGRLVLCKAFLAIAAVCLDSAARRCGLLLRFCIHKTCLLKRPWGVFYAKDKLTGQQM
jgi:hypothetical protein